MLQKIIVRQEEQTTRLPGRTEFAGNLPLPTSAFLFSNRVSVFCWQVTIFPSLGGRGKLSTCWRSGQRSMNRSAAWYFQNLREMGKSCPSPLHSCWLQYDGWNMAAILDQLPVWQRISQEKARALMTLEWPYQPQTAYLQASFSWGRNNLVSHHYFLFFHYMWWNPVLTDILILNECLLN